MEARLKATVVPFVLRASGTGVAQRPEAEGSAGHVFEADAYPAFGGHDKAPSPLFYALGSLTSCNQVTAALVAKSLGVSLGAFDFAVTGDLDTAVLVHGEDGNANFDKVTVRATVQTDASRRAVRRAGVRDRAPLPRDPAVQALRGGVRQRLDPRRAARGGLTA